MSCERRARRRLESALARAVQVPCSRERIARHARSRAREHDVRESISVHLDEVWASHAGRLEEQKCQTPTKLLKPSSGSSTSTGTTRTDRASTGARSCDAR